MKPPSKVFGGRPWQLMQARCWFLATGPCRAGSKKAGSWGAGGPETWQATAPIAEEKQLGAVGPPVASPPCRSAPWQEELAQNVQLKLRTAASWASARGAAATVSPWN